MSKETPRYAALFNEAAQQGEHMDDCECWRYVALNLDKECDRLTQDAARLDYLQTVTLAADFDYGENHESVLVLLWPNAPIGANLRKNIDAALAKEKA